MSAMTTVLALAYGLVMLVIGLGVFAIWIGKREMTSRFTRYGVIAAIVIIATDVVIVMAAPDVFDSVSVPALFGADCVAFFRIIAFVSVGMYSCAKLGIPSFRLFRRDYPVVELAPVETAALAEVATPYAPEETLPPKVEVIVPPLSEDDAALPIPDIDLDDAETEDAAEVEAEEELSQTPVTPPLVTAPPNTKTREVLVARDMPPLSVPLWWGATLFVVVLACVYSAALFWVARPAPGQILQSALEGLEDPYAFPWYSALAVIAVAIGEEIVFRLGIQNLIASSLAPERRSYLIASLIATTLWTFAHIGNLDPDWVKWLQVFPLGLGLSWLTRRFGIESAMLAHVLFNVAMGYLSPYIFVSL